MKTTVPHRNANGVTAGADGPVKLDHKPARFPVDCGRDAQVS